MSLVLRLLRNKKFPKVLRTRCAFDILTSTPAWRHCRVHLLIAQTAAKSARRFSKPTFQPSGAAEHWKNTVFRDCSKSSRRLIKYSSGIAPCPSPSISMPIKQKLCENMGSLLVPHQKHWDRHRLHWCGCRIFWVPTLTWKKSLKTQMRTGEETSRTN